MQTLYRVLAYQWDMTEFVVSACGLAQNIQVAGGIWDISSLHSWRWLLLRSTLYQASLETVQLPRLALSEGGRKPTSSSSSSRRSGPFTCLSSFMSLSCSVLAIKRHAFGLTAGGVRERIRNRTGFQFPFKSPWYNPQVMWKLQVYASSCVSALLCM